MGKFGEEMGLLARATGVLDQVRAITADVVPAPEIARLPVPKEKQKKTR